MRGKGLPIEAKIRQGQKFSFTRTSEIKQYWESIRERQRLISWPRPQNKDKR